ncbi:hypothetical protein JTF06_02870 [Desemzia sp. RIT804]|uniref:hypothetical protein n=1 Tax=Desemzia sp. RIT 804 TaxID=2810209 RepID=UPI00194E367A|nr:hypothetical protein [Desemzia sp. RIT 804]MBM6613836.1 hypothetical protein [Desemzia sp. RIT 804]
MKKFDDERVERNTIQALANGAVVVLLLILCKFVYLFATNTDSLANLGWDIILVSALAVTVFFSLYRSKTYSFPKSLLGKTLSTGLSKSAKKERLYKAYIPESIIFTLGFAVGSYFFEGWSHWSGELVISIIVFFLLVGTSYLWGEHKIKRYNQEIED